MKLRYRPGVRVEIEEIALAYDHALPGLGTRFLAALEHAYEQLTLFPNSSEKVFPEVRRAPLHRPFPYLVYYSPQEDWLEILAVVHGSRHERVWKRRLDE